MKHGKESNHREHRVYMFIKNSAHSLCSVNRKKFALKIMYGESKTVV
jgi:hypothetical protein